MRTRVVTVAMLAMMLVGGLAPAALAVPDSAGKANGEECWGIVSAQRASTQGGLGDHSSEQSEPRAGLGNLRGVFGYDSMGAFGSFLAGEDTFSATMCSHPEVP
jgi:hypothetical protein